MADHQGSPWSRAWGTLAVVGLAVYLGASVYEAVVVAPLWILDPPQSVRAWTALAARPDATLLFQSLTAVVVVASTMAWFLGITERGRRRWWLTLMLASVAALVGVVVQLVMPCERFLFGEAAAVESDPAVVAALTGDWMRAVALRLLALTVAAWAGYRAQLAGMLARSPSSETPPASTSAAGATRGPDFAFGDEADEGHDDAPEGPNPRQKWRSSLRRRPRTAKK